MKRLLKWLRQHTFACSTMLTHLRHAPGSFALNVLVIALVFTLPFAGLTLLDNIKPISQQITITPEISLFLAMDTTQEEAAALAPAIRKIVPNAKIAFIPRKKALDILQQKSDLSDVLTTLGENPLPDSYVLQLGNLEKLEKLENTEHIQIDIENIEKQLSALPNVETVQIDSNWIKRLAALLHIFQIAFFMLAGTLAIVVIAIIFNTIRLQILTQLNEIQVSRLVGATDAFIHRPFYYSGILLSISAAGTALVIVTLALQPLNKAIATFAQLYGSSFQIMPLDLWAIGALLITSAALGFFGAMLSVKYHLRNLA